MNLRTPPGLLLVCTAPVPWQQTPFCRSLVVQWAKDGVGGQPGPSGVRNLSTRPRARGSCHVSPGSRGLQLPPSGEPRALVCVQGWASSGMGWVTEVGLPEGHLASLMQRGVSFLQRLCSQVRVVGVFLPPWPLVARLPWLQFCPGSSSMRLAQFSSVQGPCEVLPLGRGWRLGGPWRRWVGGGGCWWWWWW